MSATAAPCSYRGCLRTCELFDRERPHGLPLAVLDTERCLLHLAGSGLVEVKRAGGALEVNFLIGLEQVHGLGEVVHLHAWRTRNGLEVVANRLTVEAIASNSG